MALIIIIIVRDVLFVFMIFFKLSQFGLLMFVDIMIMLLKI